MFIFPVKLEFIKQTFYVFIFFFFIAPKLFNIYKIRLVINAAKCCLAPHTF